MPKTVVKLPPKPPGLVEEDLRHDGRIIKDITFFGDSSIPEDSEQYKLVWETAKLLAENGYAIVNGGGPGVMKAATDGAESVGGHTVGIFWEPKLASIFEGKNLSNVTDESETYSNYIQRTLGLIEKGHVYVICRGGTGTVSEFGLVWALAKLYFGKHKPVILFGEFWRDVINAMQKGLSLDDNELGVLNYATTKEEVLELIQTFELEVQTRTKKTYSGDETPFVLAPRFDKQYQEYLQQKKAMHKHRVQNYITRRQLEDFKELVKQPARVLDVGVGAGYDLSFLSEHYSVTALENNSEIIEMARFENPNADILEMDIRDYEVQENVFKGIWTRDVLHHLKEEERLPVLTKLAKGLVPGGVLYFVVREGVGDNTEDDMHAGKKVKKYYNYFTEEEIRALAAEIGLVVIKIEHVTRSHKWIGAVMEKK